MYSLLFSAKLDQFFWGWFYFYFVFCFCSMQVLAPRFSQFSVSEARNIFNVKHQLLARLRDKTDSYAVTVSWRRASTTRSDDFDVRDSWFWIFPISIMALQRPVQIFILKIPESDICHFGQIATRQLASMYTVSKKQKWFFRTVQNHIFELSYFRCSSC